MTDTTTTQTSTVSSDERIDIDVVGDALLGKWKKERLEARATASDPRLHTIPGQTMAEHRERVFGQLGLLV